MSYLLIVHRRVDHFFGPLLVRAENDVGDDFPLALDIAASVQFLHLHRLLVGVVLPGLTEFRFLGRELPDDLVRLDVLSEYGDGASRERRENSKKHQWAHFDYLKKTFSLSQ
jgi:hypothetical protein